MDGNLDPNPNPTGKRADRRADRHILYKEGGQAGRAGQTSRAARHGWQLDESGGWAHQEGRRVRWAGRARHDTPDEDSPYRQRELLKRERKSFFSICSPSCEPQITLMTRQVARRRLRRLGRWRRSVDTTNSVDSPTWMTAEGKRYYLAIAEVIVYIIYY